MSFMSFETLIVWAATLVAALALAMTVNLLLAPQQQCARRPAHVYVVDHRACLPIEAFIPARARLP